MEQSSSSLWPPWWPPQWPTAPAAPGTPSASSSRCASGGSRGSLTVREGGGGGGGVRGPLTSLSPPPPHPVLCCQVIEIDTAVRSRRISVDTQSPAFSTLPLFPLNNPWKLAEHRRKLPRDLPYMCRMLYIHWGDSSVLLPFFVV